VEIFIEPGTVGGILLIAGAFALWRGKFIYSVALYFLADLAWVFLTWKSGDMFGTFAITLGMLFGVLVFLKSHSGEFVKDLKIKK